MPSKRSVQLKAKCCYEHLGGTLGNRLFHQLVELGWFEQNVNTPKEYEITELGMQELIKLGVDPFERSK
ncbi:MAG: YdfF [Anaerocolumna sp.]|jgi:hypothetical protein|nr:YdfF [Anaerocolumna sp.]